MASLNEILAKGSKSFRRINAELTAAVSGLRAAEGKHPASIVVAPVSDPEPQPDLGQPLERGPSFAAGSARGPAIRPHVHFYLLRVQLLDGDNKYASVKPLLDAIRHAGLITDDREQDIDLTVTQQKVAHYLDEGTGIVITYP